MKSFSLQDLADLNLASIERYVARTSSKRLLLLQLNTWISTLFRSKLILDPLKTFLLRSWLPKLDVPGPNASILELLRIERPKLDSSMPKPSREANSWTKEVGDPRTDPPNPK